MKISNIHIENFKRISELDVAPGTHLFIVGGKNGNGKSSLLDAVSAAFGGKKSLPDRPIRDGAEAGEIVIKLDSGHIVRSDLKGGVTVSKDVDGRLAKLSSPQALLDAMRGSLAMDPLAFLRQDPKAQAKTVRELSGCDTTAIEADGKAAAEARTIIGRAVDSLVAQLKAAPEDAEAPAEPVDTATLAADLEAETRKSAAKAKAAQESERLVQVATAAEAKIEAARVVLAKAIAESERASSAAHQAAVAAESMPDGNTIIVTARLSGASEHNRRHAAAVARRALVEKMRAASAEHERLDAQVKAKRDEYRATIAAAKMPVDGLAFGSDGLTFRDIPLSQVSSAEQLRVSLAVASALAPQLRTILIREGSLLDTDSLAEVAAFCEANDLQVLMERVGHGDECSIVMHDGRVLA